MSLRKVSRTKSLSLNDDFLAKSATTPPVAKPHGPRLSLMSRKIEDTGKMMKFIDDNLIGKGVAFLGPFGRRKVVYADFATSGRSLQFLEDYIIKEVLPACGDLNCSSVVTGLQSQAYYNEATDIIRSSMNATHDDEILLCDGQFQNPTEYLIHLLSAPNQWSLNAPILFVSTCESMKNLKPWNEAGVQIERIAKTREGFLDLVDLEKKLLNYLNCGRQMIGLFSAASRLTGIIADDVATTILLHQYGAISIWDYNLIAPSSSINVNSALPGASKDGIFFSVNKFIGGLQAPNVLVLKKKLFSNFNVRHITDSSCVIGAVRATLVLQLKEQIGLNAITVRQEKICKQILSHIRTIPEIILLGSTGTTAKRLPTLCFLVRHPRGAFLHHKFVIAVLNDVFGIQAAAGSIIGETLGITGKLTVEYEQVLEDDSLKVESLRTGYTRIFLPYFMSEAEIGFIMEALKMVATEAWKLLPQYVVDDTTGDWRHHSNSLAKERKALGAIRYIDGRMMFSDRRISGPGSFPQNYADSLQTARNIFNRSRKIAQKSAMSEALPLRLTKDKLEHLRWFMLPGEAHKLLLGHSQNVKQTVPFDPNKIQVTPSLLTIYRHNSLSALEVKRFKSRSVPVSPIEIDNKPINLTKRTETPIIRFSLGGEVTTLMNLSPQRITNLIANDRGPRNRCHSWESPTSGTNDSPTIQNKKSPFEFDTCVNGLKARAKKERSCSCSSQTDIHSFDSDNNLDTINNSFSYNVNSASGSECAAEDIQAYVKEVTKELAIEIKSEIRDVISQVEDVLENSESIDTSSLNISSYSAPVSNSTLINDDSVSATDVADYLKQCSKEITSEVKSEIREMVNAVDEFISPDCQSWNQAKTDKSDRKFENRIPTTASCIKQRHSEQIDSRSHIADAITISKQRSESYPRPNSSPGWHMATATCPENSTPTCPYTGAISKLVDCGGTTSQDSGINMCFPESIDEMRNKTLRNEAKLNDIKRQPQATSSPIQTNNTTEPAQPAPETNKQSPASSPTRKSAIVDAVGELDPDALKWHNLPKDVWKHSAEAMDEYKMLKDGDKILVCLSGSSASLCLLHGIRQFSRIRQIQIDLGAITIGTPGIDPRVLMLYMKDLGIPFILDQHSNDDGLKAKLSIIARRKGYNVLAMGETLDRLADDFLVSVLYKGKMHATRAHCIREGDIRIIRPFIFIRERLLEDFAIQKDFPIRPSKIVNRQIMNASNSILKVQELINPNVYDNIKNALKPLMSLKIEATKTSYDFLLSDFKTRD